MGLRVKVINKSSNPLPKYQTKGSAGMDIHAELEKDAIIKPLQRTLIPTGLFFEIPLGYEIQIRPRSGLALKNGVTIPNSPATIDSDYRGELKVILLNMGQGDFIVKPGDRIAQIVIAKHELIDWKEVDNLEDPKTRGVHGFGSTGK